MNEIASLITTVGFPIVSCLGLAWYVKWQTENNNKEVREMRQEHQDEINKVTEALNNNTVALQKLCDKFDNMVCKVKEE